VKETFRKAVVGDRPSASEFNKLTNATAKRENAGPPYGEQMVDLGGVRGTAKAPPEFLVVRIVGIVVPESSPLYEASKADATDPQGNRGEEAYNAIQQVWDEDELKWTDHPNLECNDVIVLDDQTGWRPLVENDILPVRWKKDAGRYVPLESREAAIVMATGAADESGYTPGVIVVFESESEMWVPRGVCWIVDVGSQESAVTEGMTGEI